MNRGLVGYGIIAISLFVAMVMSIAPLPEQIRFFRPDWSAMVLVYWSLHWPMRVGIASAWTMGLFMDVLLGSLLGSHALCYTLSAFIAVRLHSTTRKLLLIQQSLLIGGLLFMQLILLYWIKGSVGQAPDDLLYWAPALVGMITWPLIGLLLERFVKVNRNGE